MLSIVTTSKRPMRTNADARAPKMHIQEQHTKAKADRENIARRQRLSEEAHIKRFANQDKTAHITKRLPERWTLGDRKQVAARITIRNAPVAVAHDSTDTDATSKTTSRSSSRCDKSSSEPDSDKGSASIETDQTSHHESNGGKTALKLSKMLMLLNGEYATLRDKLHSARQQLSEKDARYQALEQKYAEQRGQRINDKQLVDDWAQEAADTNAYCEEVEEAKQVLESRLTDATEKYQVEIEVKDREIETLKAGHDLAITAKDVKAEKWQQAYLQKNSTFQKTVTKLIGERDEVRVKANREKRKIWETSRTKTDDLNAKLEALGTKYDRMAADTDDAISKNEDTIIGLVARNQQLELEHATMSRMLQRNYMKGSELHQLRRVMEPSTASKEEAKELRATVKQLKEQNENLLDTLQNIKIDCTRHREAEQDMRAVSNRAHNTVQLLQDKLALAKTQVRDLVKELEQVEQGDMPAGAHCAALDAVELENEELRNSLQAERDEKAEIQAKFDKLDSDHLSLSIEHDIVEAELIESKKSSSTLRDGTEASMQELRMLRKVVQGQQGVLGEHDQRELLALVSKTTEENMGLVESTVRMEAKLQRVEQYGATIEDKSESEVMKAKHHSDYWYHLYHNEAVPTTERLHAELAVLKAEKGEQHFVEPTPPANPVVFDRKMLPCATMHGLAGVPAHLLNSAVYDAEGVTHLSATLEALQTLRPQGWQPVVIAGKVWLSKMVKPFSEEEAAGQIQAGGHTASLSSAGSGQSSMSNTYAPRNARIPTSTSVYDDLPSDYSNLPTPFLVHTSSKRAHNPVIPKRGNQAAAEREVARPNAIQAPKPKSKPQATRRVAQPVPIESQQVPEYRSSWQQINKKMTQEAWDGIEDDLKIDWVKMFVKTEDG